MCSKTNKWESWNNHTCAARQTNEKVEIIIHVQQDKQMKFCLFDSLSLKNKNRLAKTVTKTRSTKIQNNFYNMSSDGYDHKAIR